MDSEETRSSEMTPGDPNLDLHEGTVQSQKEDDVPMSSQSEDITGHRRGWVEMDKHQELENKVESLQKSLSEANKVIEVNEGKVKRLKERLSHFTKEYPEFEWRREWYLELLEEEKVNTALLEELNKQVDQAYLKIREQEDQVSGLTCKIDKLKAKAKGKEPSSELELAIQEFLNVDGRDAIFILPEEVWRLILNQLADPKDLWNCSHSCTLFKKILHDFWKPTWLFQQAIPLIFRYLTTKKVLKCRLISKGWNMVVDQYLEGHPSLRPHDKKKDKFDSRMLPFVTSVEERKLFFLNKFDFNRDWETIGNPGFPHVPERNPFLGRAVTLVIGLNGRPAEDASDDDDSDFDDYYFTREWKENHCNRFWAGIRSFLETYGEHIWYLTLNSREGQLGSEDDDEHGYQEEMLRLLTADIPSMVPNLRKLRILSYGAEDYRKLEANIDIGSLQAAPKLETIQADEPNLDAKHAVLAALLKRNHSTIRALHLNRYMWRTVWKWKLEWANLTELYLNHLDNEVDFKWLHQVEVYGGMKMPLLRKLGVNLRGLERSFDWLLDAIHRLSGTAPLTTLRICGGIQQPKMFQQSRWKFCMVPTLKTLEVEHGKGADFYAFLIHFPLVENIHVFLKRVPPLHPRPRVRPPYFFRWEDDDEQHSEVDDDDREVESGSVEVTPGNVDLSKYLRRGRIYQSNIWELMPRLKLLTFKWDQFTRAGYEEFKEENAGKSTSLGEKLI